MTRAQRRRRDPSRREIGRLAARAEAEGCGACGRRFADLRPYHMVRTQSGALAVRCGECLAGTTPLFVGFYAGGGDPWVVSDRDWFASHPTRRWRLREPMPGERETLRETENGAVMEARAARIVQAQGKGWSIAVIVRQIEPGMRSRSLAAVKVDDPLDSFTDAGILRMIPGLADKPWPDVEASLRHREELLLARLDRVSEHACLNLIAERVLRRTAA
jgi:hypothetical protein